MRMNKQEFTCKLLDMSVGGAAFLSSVQVDMDERIIAYLDQLGGIDGTVVRFFDGGFAIRLNATQHKREKLASQIMWMINRHELSGAEERRHERFALTNRASTIKLAEGHTVNVRMLDVSISGVSVATDVRPPLGTDVLVGKLRARVMRHHEQGIGLQFLDIQDPEALRRHFA